MRVLGALMCAMVAVSIASGVAGAPGASTAGAQGSSPALRGVLSPAQSPLEPWPAAAGLVQTGAKAAASACEICIYVMENKAINQPYLCRGLKDPASQKMVSASKRRWRTAFCGSAWLLACAVVECAAAPHDRPSLLAELRSCCPGAPLLAPPAPSLSVPAVLLFCFAVREHASEHVLVDGQRGLLGQLRMPARAGWKAAVGEALPRRRHVQLDQADFGRRERQH